MKRFIFILPLLSLIVISCHREPIAEATVDLNPAYVGEYVRFTSFSTNADYVEWDMDDGIMYTTPVVDHYFVDPGFYDVTLRAFGTKGGVSSFVIPVEVIGSELTIIVQEYWDEYYIADAEIYLFLTLADWDTGDENLAIGPFYTDSYGEVTISGLSYQNYYVDAYYWDGINEYANWDLGWEDEYWIETDPPAGLDNTFIAWVAEIIPDGKKSAPTGEEVRKGRIPYSRPAGQLKATGQDHPLKENKSSEKREAK